MLNMLSKFVLWCIVIIAISALVVLVLYRMAFILAILAILLGIGFAIGIPLVIVAKYKYNQYLKETQRMYDSRR